MCMGVSTGANLDGLKAEDTFGVCDCMHDSKSNLNSLFSGQLAMALLVLQFS